MLPNELIDKILEYKYHYRDFKKFLSNIRKVNQEYKNKCKFIEYDWNSEEDKDSSSYILYINCFCYNYRPLNYAYITNNSFTRICNPNCGLVDKISKNYY